MTNPTTGVTFDNIYLEMSMGINFIFANGHRLVVNSSVIMQSNGSVCSGETSGSNVIAIGGSYQGEVAATNMTLNGGSYEYVIGGGLGQAVTGDVNLTVGANSGEILGGGYCGNVGGSTYINANGNVGVLGGVYGGCYYGDVGGSTNVTVSGIVGVEGYGAVAGGSCYRGSVAGDTNVTINGSVGAGVYGGNSSSINNPNPLGPGNNQRYSQKANEQVLYPAAKTMDAGSVGGDTHVTVNAGGVCREAVYGGGSDTPVKGSTYVTISGTVYGDANAEGVYGGGAGMGSDVICNTNVTIDATASIPMREVENYIRSGYTSRLGGAVFGGGRFNTVHGNTNVIVNGKVGTEGLGGLVFGGGYGIMSTGNATVAGTANVTINVAPYTYTSDKQLGWVQYNQKFGKQFWGQTGIFGGGMNCDCDATSVININADLNGNPVYGDGLYEWVTDKSTINVNKGGVVYKVWGWYDDEETNGYYKRADGDYAKVIFTGNTSSAVQLNNLDLVKVTNGSDVTIDNAKADNRQLVGVKDLAIDKSAKLTLLANAAVSGNYTGDGTGTLAVPANAVTDLKSGSARLTLGGSVIGKNNISIADNGGVKPAVNQIYVKAANAKTDSAESFGWLDARNGVKMAQRVESGSSVWYLAAGPSDPVTPVVPTPVPTDPGTVIPDPDVPTTDEPTTDIPDDNTPKADAGKQTTGDSDIALISGTVAVISLGGLVYVSMKGKKEDK